MNNIRWTVTFKTIKEKTAIVYIGDRNFSGTPIALEPALDTLTLDAVSDKLTDPVRTETGYLRIIDNGDLADLLPVGAMDRPVELHIDGELCWRGYITPATYTSGWEVTPKIQEIPLQSALSVLSTFTIGESGNSFLSIATLLLAILDKTDFSWSGVQIPLQMTAINGQSMSVPELRLRLSRYNFLTLSNVNPDDPDYTNLEGKTYLEVLSAICQYFGWQAVEYADTLVLQSNRYDVFRYHTVSYTSLQLLSYDYSAEIPEQYLQISNFDESILTYDGLGHTYSIIPGYRKVSVTANPNIVESLSPQLDTTGKVVLTDTHTANFYARNIFIQPAADIILHRWENGQEVAYRNPASLTDLRDSLTAQIVRNDTPSGNIINYNYTDYIRLSRGGRDDIVRLATLTGRDGGVFPSGGAMCLSLNVNNSLVYYDDKSETSIFDGYGLSAHGPGNCIMNLSVGIGSKWWNGSEWVQVAYNAAPPIFSHYAGNRDYDFSTRTKATGTLENTKTIDDPYNGAEGYLMKIDETLSGKLQVILYNYSYDSTYKGISPAYALFVSNIRLDYYSDKYNNNAEPLKLYALTGNDYSGTLDVNLSLSSLKNNKPGRATLYYGEEPISPDNIPSYTYEGIPSLPEEYLLSGLVAMASAPTRRMELEVEWDKLRVWDRIIIDGRTYCISGMQTDIHNESTVLILSSYGED